MKKAILGITIICFWTTSLLGPYSLAQAEEFYLPAPGVMVHLSPPLNPPILKGIKLHPDNPFRFDFILEKGDNQLANLKLKEESNKLIRYFLAGLTIPEKDLWVNLSPYEKERIIPQSFGLTEMGRDLLAEDYMLKQITASLIYPEDDIGRQFWKRVYVLAEKRYRTTDISINTFNKVWIVPQKAVVYENAKAGTAYVVESKLKVMLEQDYLSLTKHEGIQNISESKNTNQIGSQIVREIVLPALEKEVNEGKNFSCLRQVYNSLLLAVWYKKKVKDSIFSQVYSDRNKIEGISIKDPQEKRKIYQQYLKAFKKGVFDYVKEESNSIAHATIPRKYFSGGMDFAQIVTPQGMKGVGELIESTRELPINQGEALVVIQELTQPADHAMQVPQGDQAAAMIAGYPLNKTILASIDPFVPYKLSLNLGTHVKNQNVEKLLDELNRESASNNLSGILEALVKLSEAVPEARKGIVMNEIQRAVATQLLQQELRAPEFKRYTLSQEERLNQEFPEIVREIKQYARVGNLYKIEELLNILLDEVPEKYEAFISQDIERIEVLKATFERKVQAEIKRQFTFRETELNIAAGNESKFELGSLGKGKKSEKAKYILAQIAHSADRGDFDKIFQLLDDLYYTINATQEIHREIQRLKEFAVAKALAHHDYRTLLERLTRYYSYKVNGIVHWNKTMDGHYLSNILLFRRSFLEQLKQEVGGQLTINHVIENAELLGLEPKDISLLNVYKNIEQKGILVTLKRLSSQYKVLDEKGDPLSERANMTAISDIFQHRLRPLLDGYITINIEEEKVAEFHEDQMLELLDREEVDRHIDEPDTIGLDILVNKLVKLTSAPAEKVRIRLAELGIKSENDFWKAREKPENRVKIKEPVIIDGYRVFLLKSNDAFIDFDLIERQMGKIYKKLTEFIPHPDRGKVKQDGYHLLRRIRIEDYRLYVRMYKESKAIVILGFDDANKFKERETGSSRFKRPFQIFLDENLAAPFLENNLIPLERTVYQTSDEAMRTGSANTGKTASNNTGGIDLTPTQEALENKNAAESIKFHIDAAQLLQLQRVPGFVPQVISLQPLRNLNAFLTKI